MSRTMDVAVVLAAVVVTPVVLAFGVNQPRTTGAASPDAVRQAVVDMGYGFASMHNELAAYMRGMDDGVADYCQEIGGDGSDHGTCVLPEPEVVKVNVPGPVRTITKTVKVQADTLQCPDGFVAWDQRKGGGEWAYCEGGARPAGAR